MGKKCKINSFNVYLKKDTLQPLKESKENFVKKNCRFVFGKFVKTCNELVIAHEMEEENDENRWEILPWALGRRWQGIVFRFMKSSSISFIICHNDDLMFDLT